MYARLCYGDIGGIVIKFMIMGESLGCCVAHLKIFGETIQSIITLFFNVNNTFLGNGKFYSVLIFLIILPFIFKDNISSLKKPSFLGDLSIVIFMIAIIILFIYKLVSKSLPEFTWEFLFPKFDFIKAFNCATALLEAYYFQAVIFAVYLSLQNRKNKVMKRITKKSLLFCTLLYALMGILCLVMYGEETTESVIGLFRKDLMQAKDNNLYIVILLLSVLSSLLVSSLFTFPLTFFALKLNFLNLCLVIKKRNNKKKINKSRNQPGTELKESILEKSESKLEMNNSLEMTFPFINEQQQKDKDNKNISVLPKCIKFLITFVLYLIILILALSANEIIVVCVFVGSTCSNVVTMLAPTLFLIVLSKINIFNTKYLWEKIVFCLGILILITFFVVQTYTIIYK